MADAQITYDSKTISLKKSRPGMNPVYHQEQKKNTSASGLIETINVYDIIKLSFPSTFSRQIFYDLLAWWAWAKQGKAFAFAFDTDRTFGTTLDDAAAAAQKNVPLTATAGATAGEFLYLKKDGGEEQEVIEIDSVDAGVKVVAVENLKYTYAADDECRHIDYYPALKADSKTFTPIIPNGAQSVTSDFYYQYTFKFIEDKT